MHDSKIYSFSAIARPDAQILILGSMPGKASLQADQYYAHPRNAFWRIMGDLIGASSDLPYESRLARLGSARIALWDVLASCRRNSSLDADIEEDSIMANDFSRFYRDHPLVTHVFFNGSKAADCYRRHVLPTLGKEVHLEREALHYQKLPSTSPAHAGMTYEAKLAAWKAAIQF